MFGSQILEVGIGLVLVYTLLSLICTSLKEIIEGRLKNRSKDLAKGVLMLLAADQRATKALYDHPLISGLYPPKSLPSYIPARSFALAVLDLAGVKSGMPNAPTPSLEDRLNAIGAQIDGSSLPDDVKTVLRRLADDAQGDTRRFRENVERWFDGAMDRVSGWYKRRAQWIILGLGLLVVVTANADTISIAYALAHDPAAREALVAQSLEYSKQAADQKVAASAADRLAKVEAEISKLGVPLGWSWTAGDPRAIPLDWTAWASKVTGWLLTAVAISLGAPFWFDVLNKIAVIRSTVKPHEKSPEEESKQ